ncbi:hypothetical protein [Ohtaekwangia sp.]|uniref:hypothetical protein n=1 Tax=Ohtaekwangia sp. TaxID=2066019 RepID=UPI002F94A506
MKRLGLVIILIAVVTLVNAQDVKTKSESYPYWTISKDVQRLPYRNVKYIPAKISTGDLALNVSKGVQRLNAQRAPRQTGYITMPGYPAWIISKGVARMQYEKSNPQN